MGDPITCAVPASRVWAGAVREARLSASWSPSRS